MMRKKNESPLRDEASDRNRFDSKESSGSDRKTAAARKRIIRLALVLLSAILMITGLSVFLLRKNAPVPELAGKRVVLAGDSRSSTDYTFYREILERKTGCMVLAEGASGKNAAYNASDGYISRIAEKEHDFSIWLVGGNDTGSAGTVGTFSASSALGRQGEAVVPETDLTEDYQGNCFIQAIDHMMRKYQRECSENGKTPVMIFCTDIPQQRYDQNDPWSLQENWERKRLAILECCEKNQISCLDLYTLCAFDMSREPVYTPPTDLENNRGHYYMDGLHPNEKGIDLITDYEIEAMKQCLKP